MSEWWLEAEPISEEETAWAEAYWEHLAVGDVLPDAAGLDPRRVARIREVLDGRWRGLVRRITHQPGGSSRKSGFGHRTYQADELEEKAEALEQWADELEGWEPSEEEQPEQEEGQDKDEYQDAVDAWLDEARGEADSLAGQCPV